MEESGGGGQRQKLELIGGGVLFRGRRKRRDKERGIVRQSDSARRSNRRDCSSSLRYKINLSRRRRRVALFGAEGELVRPFWVKSIEGRMALLKSLLSHGDQRY